MGSNGNKLGRGPGRSRKISETKARELKNTSDKKTNGAGALTASKDSNKDRPEELNQDQALYTTLTYRPPRTLPQLTRVKRAAFLRAYSRLGTITAAAVVANIEPKTHRNWMDADPEYRLAFQEAADLAVERMEQEAHRRAVAGWEEPVYQQGRMVGTVRRFDSTLLIFLLKGRKPEMYRENYQVQHTGPNGGPIQVLSLSMIKEILDPPSLPPPSDA